jgi:hypothetical protein
MYTHNNTQAFMEKKFQSDDYQYIHQMARKAEAQKEEANRKREIVEHAQARVKKQMDAINK